LSDDPIVFTGGGSTELDLELFFDVSLARMPMEHADVRELTRPLWNLAENRQDAQGYGQPPLVRFIWGKEWNIRGVVVAVAERLGFSPLEGAPQRSWMHLRLLRVSDIAERLMGLSDSLTQSLPDEASAAPIAADDLRYHIVASAGRTGESEETAGERL